MENVHGSAEGLDDQLAQPLPLPSIHLRKPEFPRYFGLAPEHEPPRPRMLGEDHGPFSLRPRWGDEDHAYADALFAAEPTPVMGGGPAVAEAVEPIAPHAPLPAVPAPPLTAQPSEPPTGSVAGNPRLALWAYAAMAMTLAASILYAVRA